MQDQLQDEDCVRTGDKVRIRSGTYAKAKGVVQAKADNSLEIQLDEGLLVHVMQDEITNYSLAARRAWQVMPKRAGRQQLAVPRKRMVSLRLDIDILDDFAVAIELGLISNKEQTVNIWLRQQLNVLLGRKSCSDVEQE